ncbi:uncharacterized protein LOC121428000 [Lytechinus variegatus]|uniref:uncharacterized protein LOC121428000 n=1 Tax=Lytechinus variegatus TaxID=7654 RepID=UPI001BB22DDD|nr:uncharacterized protein LOC121428000 [Lytechinus variegatus]
MMEGLNMVRLSWLVIILQGSLLNVSSSRAEEERIVIVSTNTRFYLSKGPSYNFNLLPISVGSLGGFDFDGDIDMIFWTDSNSRTIKRAKLDDTRSTRVISTERDPGAIAIDENESLIFWTHYDSYRYKRTIERITYDGRERTIINEGSQYLYVHSIVLDKITRTIYWTEGNAFRSCSYEGLNKKTLFTLTYDIGDLALNVDGGILFFCEGSFVKTYDLISGGSQVPIYEELSSTCSSLAWFEGDLYMASGRPTFSIKDGDTDDVSQVALSPSRPSTSKIVVGRRSAQDLGGGKCDFDSIKCQWRFENSKSNDLDWIKWGPEQATRNSTGSNMTDHTKQGQIHAVGQYMLLNTSSGPGHLPGDVASLISQPVDASGPTPKCFQFWYYMHDVINGSLTVFFEQVLNETTGETKRTPLWSAFGSQLEEWVGAEFEVWTRGVGRVLISAVVGDPALNIIGIDDVYLGECHQDSRLVCEDSSMTVYLDKARLGISSHDKVSFKNSLCQGDEYDAYTVAITTPYNGCGTTVTESDDVIIFSNEVKVMIQSDLRSSRSIRINCSLSRTYHVKMTYLAHAWIRHIKEDGYGNFSVRIRQYTNVNFEDAYPGNSFPQQVEVDNMIYMATEMVAIVDVVDTIQNTRCWATPSPDPLDAINRDIISDGCPIGDDIEVYSLLRRGLQAFSFKAFALSSDKNLIYVHCDIIICHDSNQLACRSNCSHSRPVRETRDTRNSGFGPYTVSRGPFIFNKARTHSNDGAPVNIFLLSALVCITMLFLATVFMVAFIYARMRRGGGRN